MGSNSTKEPTEECIDNIRRDKIGLYIDSDRKHMLVKQKELDDLQLYKNRLYIQHKEKSILFHIDYYKNSIADYEEERKQLENIEK